MNWNGPVPPVPASIFSSEEERKLIQEKLSRFFVREKEYWDYCYYWDRWFMKVYRWWSINILGRDSKPHFEIRY